MEADEGSYSDMELTQDAAGIPQVEFDCSHCGKKFSAKHLVARHEKYSCGKNRDAKCSDMPLQCDRCFQRFRLDKQLTYHIKHECNVQHKCPHCKQLFATRVTAKHFNRCKALNRSTDPKTMEADEGSNSDMDLTLGVAGLNLSSTPSANLPSTSTRYANLPSTSTRPANLPSTSTRSINLPSTSTAQPNFAETEGISYFTELAPEANTAQKTSAWLRASGFNAFHSTFASFSASDMLRLSRDDLIQICGLADGIRLFNALHSKAPTPKLTLYFALDGDGSLWRVVYLDRLTSTTFTNKLLNTLSLPRDHLDSVLFLGPQGIHVLVTDELVANMTNESMFFVETIKDTMSERYNILLKPSSP